MGLRNIMMFTVGASLIEWFIYFNTHGRYGIEVSPELLGMTIPIMVIANFASAHLAQYIFTGRVTWKLK